MAMAFAVVVMLGCTAPMRTAGAEGGKKEVGLETIHTYLFEQDLTMTYGSTAQSIDLTGISCPSYPGTCTMVAKAGSDTLPAGTSQEFELIYTLTDETYKNYCFVDKGEQLQSWTFMVPVKITPKVIQYADITWPEASPIVYGQSYGASTLSFPSDAYGTFDWDMSQDNRNSWYPVAVDSENFVIRYQLTDDKNYTILDGENYVSYAINKISVRVNPASLNSISIKGSSSVTYTGNDYYSNAVNISNVQTSAGHLLTADMYSLSVTKDGVAVTEVKDAGTYTVTATPTDVNYTGTASTTFTVKPAQLGSINFNVPDSTTYNASDHYETAANVEVRTTDWNRVPMSQYTLSVTKNGAAVTKIVDVGTYTVTATGKGNYSGTVSTKFTVKPLRLSGLWLNASSGTYSGGVVQANSLSATVEASIMVGGQETTLTLNRSDFEVTSDRPIQDVGTYTISVSKLNNANYTLENANIAPATFTVTPALVSRIVLNQTSSVYNGETVKLADLSATVYATDGTTEFVMPTSAYSLFSNSGEIKLTGRYFVGVSLKDTTNYTNPNNPKVTYTVLQAPVTSVELTTSAMTYRGTAVNTSELKAVVKAGNLTLTEGTDYQLFCDRTIQDAGTYQIRVSVSNPVEYANPDSKTAIFTVTPAPLTGFTLNTTGSPYTGSAVAPDSLSATLTAAGGLTLSRADYTLTCDKPIQNAGTYTIGYTLKNANYTTAGATAPATAPYTVTPANVSSVTLAQTTSVYSGSAVELGTLSATVKALSGSGEITLPATAYRLVCDETLLNAGTYTIGMELVDTANYTNTGAKTASYTITPANVSSVALAQTTSVYSGSAVELGTLSATVKALSGSGEITLPATAYRLVCDETLLNAGTYTIGMELVDTANYTNTGAKTATYTITPAKVKQLTLGVKQRVYDGGAVDLTSLQPTVVAETNGGALITLLYGDAYRLEGAEAVQVGTYVLEARLLDQRNYVADAALTDTFEILRRPVAPLSVSCGVTNSQGESVLGGPTGQGHRTITLKGEPNEQVVVIVNGTLRSDPLQLNASGVATLTVNGNGTVGTLTLSGETALTLDGSGAGQAFTLTAAYRDEANLRDSQQEAAPARAQVRCRYDMEAQPVRVAQLYNRGAEGVVVDLPEDMAEISFASRSDAGVTFSGSRTGLMKGDAQVIAFDGTGKLHSTALDPASRYDVTYTDLVGNTGAVENQTVERAAGTLTIASVDPAPKANKRIGRTDELTWTITCAFDGSDEEKAILTLGDRAFDTVLKPGTNTVIVDASRIQMDRLLDVSISYEDLTGTATFGSFVYDAKCDAPVLTSVLYEGCSVLTGIVEPDSRVVLKVNDARVTCTVDAFGTFAVEMPEVQEGDTVEIIVTDRAVNVTVTTCAVGPARETVQLKTFMLGKTYTDAHITLPGGEPRWTMITTVTADALRDGKVVLPIVAGNLLQVGTMTMRLDDEGAICYEYELNEGVTLLSEDVRLYTTLAPKEAMAHTGLLLSPGESTPLPSQQSTYYVTAEFVVEVAADQLLTTFQLETADENALKQAYLDRQNNRPLK